MTKQTELLRFGLLALAAGAIVYFITKAKKKTEVQPETTVNPGNLAPSVSVTQKITLATQTGTLSEADLKKYAGLIDRIIQILAQSRTERKSQYAQPTEEVLSNADTLNKLTGDNLRAVANYWTASRGNNLGVLDMFLDESGRLIELTVRLDELGLRK